MKICIFNFQISATTPETSERTLKYNISENTSEIIEEDASYLRTQQLTLPTFCIETLHYILSYISEKRLSFQDENLKKKIHTPINTALELTDSIIDILIVIIHPSIWSEKDNNIAKELIGILDKFGVSLVELRLMVGASEMQYLERMTQLYLLISLTKLIRHLIPINLAKSILPRSLKHALSSCLLDPSFGRLYPEIHEHLVLYVSECAVTENEMSLNYDGVRKIIRGMSSAVKIFRYEKTSDIHESLILILDSLPSLGYHRNFGIIDIFLGLCLKIYSTVVNVDTQAVINDIAVALLSHDDEEISREMFKKCYELVKSRLGVDSVKSNGIKNSLVFFVQSKIINAIVTYGVRSEDGEVSRIASDTISYILKSKVIVSDDIWQRYMNSIILSFPLLSCLADRKSPLGKTVLKMFDPDVSPSVSIPTLEVIKANLRFLYHKDDIIRKEAVARLSWLLTSENDYEKKLPKIKTLENETFSQIFQLNRFIDLTKTRNAAFYQISNLYQVLELLNSPVDPGIRRSAIAQISVMLTDEWMHTSFLERKGLEIILKILHENLFDGPNTTQDYLPMCITILKNLCLHNSIVRQELSMNIDLFYCLIRVLILHGQDRSVAQDSAVLFLMLLFCDCLSTNSKGLSLLHMVKDTLNIPIKCGEHGINRNDADSKLSETWNSTLRIHWNLELFGGVNEILKSSNIKSKQNITFNSDLRLLAQDLVALKATSIPFCCEEFLVRIQNATTHEDVFEAIRGLFSYINLWFLSNDKTSAKSLLRLPWKETFMKFLNAPPANSDDQDLLVDLLRFLTKFTRVYENSEGSWIKEIFLTSSQNLPNILLTEVHCEDRSISLELLTLISESTHRDSFYLKPTEKCSESWIFLMYILTENLKYNDSSQFYNLTYLDGVLSCLVELTTFRGWSEVKHHAFETTALLSDLVSRLWELLDAFNCQHAASLSSYMGVGVTRNALVAMNHILGEMQVFSKSWETHWFDVGLESACALWRSRDALVRCSALQLVAGLAASRRGATAVATAAERGVWPDAVRILLDAGEAALVREQAAAVLTNLSGHAAVSTNGEVSLPLAHAALSCQGKYC